MADTWGLQFNGSTVGLFPSAYTPSSSITFKCVFEFTGATQHIFGQDTDFRDSRHGLQITSTSSVSMGQGSTSKLSNSLNTFSLGDIVTVEYSHNKTTETLTVNGLTSSRSSTFIGHNIQKLGSNGIQAHYTGVI